MKMEQSVPKRRHIKFRRRGITQKKAYNELKFCLYTPLKHIVGLKIQLLFFLTLALNVGECSASHFSHFTPRNEPPVPIQQEDGGGRRNPSGRFEMR
jgi:hypothetical protein